MKSCGGKAGVPGFLSRKRSTLECANPELDQRWVKRLLEYDHMSEMRKKKRPCQTVCPQQIARFAFWLLVQKGCSLFRSMKLDTEGERCTITNGQNVGSTLAPLGSPIFHEPLGKMVNKQRRRPSPRLHPRKADLCFSVSCSGNNHRLTLITSTPTLSSPSLQHRDLCETAAVCARHFSSNRHPRG